MIVFSSFLVSMSLIYLIMQLNFENCTRVLETIFFLNSCCWEDCKVSWVHLVDVRCPEVITLGSLLTWHFERPKLGHFLSLQSRFFTSQRTQMCVPLVPIICYYFLSLFNSFFRFFSILLIFNSIPPTARGSSQSCQSSPSGPTDTSSRGTLKRQIQLRVKCNLEETNR